jgi:phospholipid-binding lipoprotein MlaA
MISRRLSVLLLACSAALGGCATVPADPAARSAFEANHDPYEPLNRKVFAFNLVVDRYLIKPMAEVYRHVLPQRGRDAARHFLDNLNEPIVLTNLLLQGRFHEARITEARFIINSTIGIAGLRDAAARQQMPRQIGDFGQTLWSWGVKESPYLILPVLGPSSPRDGIGMGADVYLDPFRYVVRDENFPSAVTVSRLAADGIDKRSRNIEALDEMEHEAVDYYASFRSLFRQHRAAELNAGRPAPLPSADFYSDPGSP